MQTTYYVKKWRTLVSDMKGVECGNWSIRKKLLPVGFGDEMTSLDHDYWKVVKPITVTTLEETILWDEYVPELDPPEYKYEQKIWMSDSPYEYFGQLGLVNRIHIDYKNGKYKKKQVLVGGLGLGLIVHFLILRRDIDKIYIVELSNEVISLVWSFITKKYMYNKIMQLILIEGDYNKALRELSSKIDFDVIITDIWQSNTDEDEKLFLKTKKNIENNYPNAQHLYWIFQSDIEAGKYK